MIQVHPLTQNPLTSWINGTGAGKLAPFLQPKRPFLSMFQEACQKIQLPKITDSRGSLSFIEGGNHIPFKIASAFWISDVTELTAKPSRGRSAGRQEFIIPISGSIEVTYDNGWVKRHVRLDRPDLGLYVPNSSRRRVRALAAGTVVLVLTAAPDQRKDSRAEEVLKRSRLNDYRSRLQDTPVTPVTRKQ